jgi:predicted phosphodiesterase
VGLYFLLSFGGTVISVATLGRTVYRWHGFAVELRLLPASRGQTALVLVPLGEVHAHTHRAPVELIATLQEIQIEEINKVLSGTPRLNALTKDFEISTRRDLRDFVTRQLLCAAIGGLLAPLLLRSKKVWKYFLSSLLGVAIVGITLGSALASFNGKAFESPTYTGALRQAPWVIQFGKDAFVRIEELSQKLRTVAANLNVLYGRISEPPDRLDAGSEADTVRILHVSDLHNNPAGLTFIKEVTRQFRISLIVDTGDLTDFGSPPETAIVQELGKMGCPYVFVAGNHDSQAVLMALARLNNVTVLDGQLATVEGLTILGRPNPAASRTNVGNVDTTPEELQAGSNQLLADLRALREPPDIVAIHNPEETRPIWGSVPLVLTGHMHRYYVDIEKGQETISTEAQSLPGSPKQSVMSPRFDTVVCNAGTTGAAGLRYFEKEQGVPFSCAVLTFRRKGSVTAAPPAVPSETVPRDDTGTQPQSGTASGVDPSAPPQGSTPGAPPAHERPRLISIDLIVLDGALHQYSITHRPFAEPAAMPVIPR